MSKINLVFPRSWPTAIHSASINEGIFFKKLSKKISLLQSKYGLPSDLKNQTFVASADCIFLEPKTDRIMDKVKSQNTPKPKKHRNTFVPLLMFMPQSNPGLSPTISMPNLYMPDSNKIGCSKSGNIAINSNLEETQDNAVTSFKDIEYDAATNSEVLANTDPDHYQKVSGLEDMEDLFVAGEELVFYFHNEPADMSNVIISD